MNRVSLENGGRNGMFPTVYDNDFSNSYCPQYVYVLCKASENNLTEIFFYILQFLQGPR